MNLRAVTSSAMTPYAMKSRAMNRLLRASVFLISSFAAACGGGYSTTPSHAATRAAAFRKLFKRQLERHLRLFHERNR